MMCNEEFEVVNADKLFAWIMSMIDVSNTDYKRDFVPIWDMIKQINDEDYCMVRSKYYLDGRSYEFKMSLERF